MSEIKLIKRKISNAIKDLDRPDYIDVCVLIKSNSNDTSMISETPRGTFIDLDRINDGLVQQLYHMIDTKLQRISKR